MEDRLITGNFIVIEYVQTGRLIRVLNSVRNFRNRSKQLFSHFFRCFINILCMFLWNNECMSFCYLTDVQKCINIVIFIYFCGWYFSFNNFTEQAIFMFHIMTSPCGCLILLYREMIHFVKFSDNYINNKIETGSVRVNEPALRGKRDRI